MTLGVEQLQAIAAEWRDARLIYPIYRGVIGRFSLNIPPCQELETPIDSARPEAVTAVQDWLRKAGEAIQVHQLRVFVQASPLAGQTNLGALIRHHVSKRVRSAEDQDKLDFLLVQYFAQCAPAALLHSPSLQDVAGALHPVLGEISGEQPEWLEVLENASVRLGRCRQLRELLQQGILPEIRRIKSLAKEAYFGAGALVAFARINFLTRQTFVRLMQTDLDAICTGVRWLQNAGVKTLNCERAQLSSKEALEHVLEQALQWKKPFQTDYSAGNPFTRMAALRTVVDEAVAHRAGASLAKSPPVAKAAHLAIPAAGVDGSPGKAAPRAHAAAASAPATSGSSKKAAPKPSLAPSRANVRPAPVETSRKKQPASPNAAPAAAGTPAAVAGELRKVLAQLFSYLRANQERIRTAGATIVLGNAKLALSSWEVNAFADGGQHAEAIQLGVGIRVLLFQALEQMKQGGSRRKLDAIMALGRNQIERLRKALAAAGAAREVEATVALSATAQRLTELLGEAAELTASK